MVSSNASNNTGKARTMDKLAVKTNNKWNEFVYGTELPLKVKANFDYIEDIETADFIKYKGRYYHLADFMVINDKNSPLKDWHAYNPDSYFSGLVVRLNEDGQYKIGTYYSTTENDHSEQGFDSFDENGIG